MKLSHMPLDWLQAFYRNTLVSYGAGGATAKAVEPLLERLEQELARRPITQSTLKKGALV